MAQKSHVNLSELQTLNGTLAQEPEIIAYESGAQRVKYQLVYEQKIETSVVNEENQEQVLQGYAAQFLEAERYIPAHQGEDSPFLGYHKGDDVTIKYVTRKDSFTGRDGKPKERTYQALIDIRPQGKESRWVRSGHAYSGQFTVTGRLTQEPERRKKADGSEVNADGSVKIYLSLFSEEAAVVNQKGDLSQNLKLEVLVPPEEAGNSIYERLHSGDEISVDYVIRTDYFAKKKGDVLTESTSLYIRGIRDLTAKKAD